MHNFSPQSKVWVYQSDRVFTTDEVTALEKVLAEFTQQWTAHNQQLKAKGEILHHRFIILMVDESQAEASGCSIDKSVHFLQEIEKQLGISLFNRQLVSIKDGEEVKTFTLNAIKTEFANNNITANTLVFNTLVTTKQQFDTEWELPISQTWVNRFLPKQTA
jgi:hypothetical protein